VKTPLVATVPVGNLGGYLLTVHNESTVPAAAVSVSDQLPAGFKLRDYTGGPCVLIGGKLTCSFDLAAQETRTIRVNGAFLTAGTVSNTAVVSSQGDPVASNNTSSAAVTATGKSCTIVGTFGNDNPLLGTNGNDVICGLSGNDRINAKQGDDTIYGNEGDDRIMGLGGNDLIDGGPGTDTTIYSALLQAVKCHLAQHKATGQGIDTLVSIENVTGSGKADTISGDAHKNVLTGLGGNDSLSGLAGADTLNGGAGKDHLAGGSGNDRMLGGAGPDLCAQGGGTGRKSSC
jgi:uncharacterized repeat protein (TIGR01451 family)